MDAHEMETPNQPTFNWHVNLDRSLQSKARILAMERNVEVRQLVSDLLRKELKEKKLKKDDQ
jgi:hypothetical protein